VNHKLFLIADLAEHDAQYCKAGEVIEVGGEKLTICAQEQGEDRRWSRTNTVIVRDSDTRHWAIPWEEGLTENQDCEGFKDHATDHGNPEYVKAWEVHPKPVQTIIWEAVK
jgi:hypothetical protein